MYPFSRRLGTAGLNQYSLAETTIFFTSFLPKFWIFSLQNWVTIFALWKHVPISQWLGITGRKQYSCTEMTMFFAFLPAQILNFFLLKIRAWFSRCGNVYPFSQQIGAAGLQQYSYAETMTFFTFFPSKFWIFFPSKLGHDSSIAQTYILFHNDMAQ